MNTIHPTALVGTEVTMGRGNIIGPFVILQGRVELGDRNWIGAGSVIGAPPEVRSWPHPRSLEEAVGKGVVIGDDNVIREYVQIHSGWKAVTRIGSRCFLMNQTYIAHDSRLSDDVTLASSVLLAGHVVVGSRSNLGLGTSVHQWRRIGDGVMVGMGSVVTHDLPPYCKAFGNPARIRGANAVGAERSGLSTATVSALREQFERSPDDRELRALRSIPELGGVVQAWLGPLLSGLGEAK